MTPATILRPAALAVGVQLALAAWGLAEVPAGGAVPVHWGPTGEADGFAEPLVAFLAVPAVTIPLGLLLAVGPRFEPRAANLERSAHAYRTVALAILVGLAGLQAFIVLAGTGRQAPVGLVVGSGIGLLLAVIGNVLGTVRSSFTLGIRTPWTLASDLAWDRTHRIVGRLPVGGGLLVALSGLALRTEAVLVLLLAVIAAALVVGTVHSYRTWRADPRRREPGRP